jgi:Fe-S cluster biogenesis protein NfuA
MAQRDQYLDTLREIIVPLVEADAGELYVVSIEGEDVRLHLAGTCAGCPGAMLTTRGVIEPALRTVSSNVRVVVSAGITIPQGAQRLESGRRA